MHGLLKTILITLTLSIGFGTASSSTTIKISDEVDGFLFSKLDKIPNGPSPITENSICEYFTLGADLYTHPMTKSIADKGWAVLSEVTFAQYLLVAFSGDMQPSTSGSCLITQSNIAIFENGDLLGILYLSDKNKSDIGKLSLMDGGFVRVFSGDFIQTPSIDISLFESGLQIHTTSAFTSFCNGESIVPKIIGKDIIAGRGLLFKLGFKPIQNKNEDLISWRQYLFDEGIVEVDSCSGTGFAFCSFMYENSGSLVQVVTAGEDNYPTIVRVMVECKP